MSRVLAMFTEFLNQLTSGADESEEDEREYAILKRSRHLLKGSASSRSLSRSSESSDSSSSSDETSSTQSSDEEEEEGEEGDECSSYEIASPMDNQLARIESQWKFTRYLEVVPDRVYKQHRHQMTEHYRLMQACLLRATPHYLLDETRQQALGTRFQCRGLYIGAQRRAPLVAPHTYLVNRELHYLYSYLVDLTLAHRGESREVKRQRRRLLRRKARAMRFYPVQVQQSHKRCPREHVLYTKRSGDLFRFCQRLMDNNAWLDYTQVGYVPMEALSYHLVNFLCGPFELIEEQRFETKNAESTVQIHQSVESFEVTMAEATDWTTVPLFFLDLWNASRSPQSDAYPRL